MHTNGSWLALLLLCASIAAGADRPNSVVITADDLGFSDLGCYGSEMDTPPLNTLAADGLRFTQFYNTAKCHSSRVSLLTGQYCIAAGDTSLSHAATTAEVLGRGGYFAAMTGKWHLKRDPTTTLPQGDQLDFDILADGKWQSIVVALPTNDRIYQLRWDVSPGAGKATIAALSLLDQRNSMAINWPAARRSQQRQPKEED